MATILEPSVTFAFSTKQDAWTTRYSFTPVCYANCGDTLLSCKSNPTNSQKGIWKHDAGSNRNKFYGDQYSSTIDLTFNDYPSDVKFFKALSLEANRDLWIGSFKTNEEHDDENNQQSNPFAQTLIDKEGVKYLEIPRSTKNSTSNISPFPRLVVDENAFDLAVSETSDFGSFEVFLSASQDQDLSSVAFSVSGGINFSELVIRQGSNLVNFNSFIEQNYQQLFGIPFIGGSQKAVQIVSINNYLVGIRSSRPNGFSGNFNLFVEALKDFLGNPNLFLVSSAKINGDQMRGSYIKVNLRCPSPDPLELYAVNVDYEMSSSASRLTQNT